MVYQPLSVEFASQVQFRRKSCDVFDCRNKSVLFSVILIHIFMSVHAMPPNRAEPFLFVSCQPHFSLSFSRPVAEPGR